ncbi:MAG: triple tyrosine motif-containing protein [Saprospiraceae bacterium]
MKGLFAGIISWITCISWLLAQETPRTINFTKDQYQAYNQNWAVGQSPQRLMFFGNNAGLLQFNGSAWQTSPLPNRQTIRAVACDQYGNIFTGGFEELGFWQTKNGKLEYHSLLPLLADTPLEKEEIWHILIKDSLIYFQSFSNIYEYNYHKIRKIVPPGAIMFMQQVQDKLLVPVIDHGIYELTSKGFRFIKGSELLANKQVMCILPYRERSYLVGTSNNGLFKYDSAGKFSLWNSEIHNHLVTNQLNKGIALSNGLLALGTILNGVYIINSNGDILYHINQKNGLQNNTVLSLYEDQAKDLWVGLDKGIDLVELSSPLTFFKDNNGTIGTVYAAAIHQGNLYIGSNHGVFVKPWHGQERFQQEADFQLIKGTQGQIWELKVFDGQLLAGHNDGTFLVNNHTATLISNVTGGWTTLTYPGKPDVLIQGTYTGLAVLKKNALGRWQLSHRIAGFTDPVNKILFDRDLNLWVVNPYRGLYRLKLDENLEQITDLYAFKKSDGLPSEFKLDIEKIDNQIIVKSDDHFFYYDEAHHRFDSYYRSDNPLLQPGDFRLKNGWMGDWFKIYRNKLCYIYNNRQVNFNITLAPEFESVIPLNDTFYLFGLDDGYALVDRNHLQKTTALYYSPEVIIHRLAVSNNKKHKYYTPENELFTFKAKENNFLFQFSQPVFTQTPEYSYLLEGYDTEWSDWQILPEKEFTRLPPGHYTFKVCSRTAPQPALFHFVIKRPWYQSGWAAIAYMLLFACTVWLVERWNQHRLERQRKILEEEKERQLEEQRIKTANERLQSDIINKSKELANSTMNLIQKNETLLKIKEELQALRTAPDPHLNGKQYQRITHLIDTHISSDQDWQVFEMNFNQVHEQFFKKLKADFPDLTPGDLKLAAYLKMNLSSKEIAPLLNISIRSVENKRYRLRKKLNLEEEANLTDFMLQY